MDYDEIVATMNGDPTVRELLAAPIPARLAYLGRNGAPRAIPVSYLWNGAAFVFASPVAWAKVEALRLNPQVALTVDETTFPPRGFMARGTASIEIVQGVPEEYVEASRRIVGEELMPSWEAEVRGKIDEMALITITPTWLKVVDFDTRFPGPG
ncbi:pyridoxamine 5'-phosphate oxidase family protein [Microlunatus sp. GCM10028923]|uniref:pyridoxamine 5'-phosphate oxidase family protein n=1 Tax=Microlunatus sp. GCM10028923 TaxID=3273400 RepID=UPI00361212E0